jgi:hypothetical protein
VTPALRAFVTDELAQPVVPEVAMAARLLARRPRAEAILFYGSVLRTGELDGLLDFYVLTDGPTTSGVRRIATRWLWPDITFEEIDVGHRLVRAKVATMPLAIFEAAASGRLIDTTIWTRFVQPAALVWGAGTLARQRVIGAIAQASVVASCFAAMIGARRSPALGYWAALFRETYTAELRVESKGRESRILTYDPERWRTLLPLAWAAAGIPHRIVDDAIEPTISQDQCRAWFAAWSFRQRAGRLLNAARLVKAAFTTEGTARYALWKIERHTGVRLTPTPWIERHPLLAAPGVLWRVWRSARP